MKHTQRVTTRASKDPAAPDPKRQKISSTMVKKCPHLQEEIKILAHVSHKTKGTQKFRTENTPEECLLLADEPTNASNVKNFGTLGTPKVFSLFPPPPEVLDCGITVSDNEDL